MILLRPDCLVFKTTDGEDIPCSAHDVTVELIGDSAAWLDTDLVAHAAEAVLHFFKSEKGKHSVSVAEFSEALERVLRGLGIDVKADGKAGAPSTETISIPQSTPRVVEADLRLLAGESDLGGELVFFPRLRDAIRRELDGSPTILRFSGLRECVKQLTGSKRWSAHCQSLSDQIVDYLRTCLGAERSGASCALVVC
jgi:hypothetical protein